MAGALRCCSVSDPGAAAQTLYRPGAARGLRVSGATGQQGGEDLTQIDLQQKVLKSGDELKRQDFIS